MENKTLLRNRRRDQWATWLISTGGIAILACVIFMLVMLVKVTLPLFLGASKRLVTQVPLAQMLPEASTAVGLGVDPYLETGYVVDQKAGITFIDLVQGQLQDHFDPKPPQEGAKPLWVQAGGNNQMALLWSDGSYQAYRVKFNPEFSDEGHRKIGHQVEDLVLLRPNWKAFPKNFLMRITPERRTLAALGENNQIYLTQAVKAEGFGDEEFTEHQHILESHFKGEVTAFTLSATGERLYAGSDRGELAVWNLSDAEEVKQVEEIQAFADQRKVVSLTLVYGGESLAVGDELGMVSTWFMAPALPPKKAKTLTLIHELSQHQGPVEGLLASPRSKSLYSLAQGRLILDHMTSERQLLDFGPKQKISLFALTERDNALLALDQSGDLKLYALDNPHPEGSWKVFFGEVWYESYPEPDYVWQSSSGSDDFEPKISLTPLIFGSIKGALYAMFFAVPIGVLGAIFTNQFAGRRFAKWVKPGVEITAAVPSVIIGFMAALWLAPIIHEWLLGFFLFLVIYPLSIGLFILSWSLFSKPGQSKGIERGGQMLLMLPLILLCLWLVGQLQPWLETAWFDGDFRQWVYHNITTSYDQRNSIIIAFGLGFIVIPFIFTMTDDALSSVPKSLGAASAALGATRWQTVWRVLLPSASPGIFAGTILGMGRAIGETMIVLMATGNTPIMDASIFNGMRTLAANIAVEIPEAPVDGTLYRVLFLSAVILFGFTFIFNSLSEIVRSKLRKRYAAF